MAQMDLSAALTNPYTNTPFIVKRRKQIVNNFGESTVEVEEIPNVRGVLYAAAQNGLTRRPEAQTNSKSIEILTRFALRGESKSTEDNSEYQPDLVLWHGNLFVVTNIEDWSNYARGFIKATLGSINIVDQPPAPKPLSIVNETTE